MNVHSYSLYVEFKDAKTQAPMTYTFPISTTAKEAEAEFDRSVVIGNKSGRVKEIKLIDLTTTKIVMVKTYE